MAELLNKNRILHKELEIAHNIIKSYERGFMLIS